MLPPVTDEPSGPRRVKAHAPDRTKAGPTPRRGTDRHHVSRLDAYFKITERGSTLEREIRGGVVTFFTMAYIVVLNPIILGFSPDKTGHFLGGGTGDGSNLAAIAGRLDPSPVPPPRKWPVLSGEKPRMIGFSTTM